MTMTKGPWSTVLLLLLASALLMNCFVTPVTSSEDQEAETLNSEETIDEPVKETFVEDKHIGAAPGVEASVYFPKNLNNVVKSGEPTQILINITNDGAGPMQVQYIRASLHLPNDHRVIIQNFTVQEYSSSIPQGNKVTFSYWFGVVKFLQPGNYDFVGKIIYELENKAYTHVFYNSTIDVVESGGFVSGETIFLSSLGLGLLGLLGMWAYSKVQDFIKKQRRSSKKVETGTRTNSDAHANEWLKGTSFTQKLSRNISQQRKAFKKKSSSKDSKDAPKDS
ncbi:translocon-associated protein subunit alpha [Physcomitrium patens]|uniref:Translocon-associated protein subunit alpha n=1 Tax=Physcomitrium patens TaxID=3218 RepID=A0A2K1ID97_PHYPA|nr:translocon-associated protein subunit alpha-like [Physcomitrium patens]XP_024365271.1 translocon-associated protein subunit alpha-like [Physcomitrium patens]PNR27253.1 hypothetical protein PHYPA_029405 [Physcomitrium patens]|eukprot:XP_024365269.1 translocon-associated protein subunit alpha-like [Physcomitrella patens]